MKTPSLQETYEQAKHLGQNTASTLGNSIRPLPDDAPDEAVYGILMDDVYRTQTPENEEGLDEYCRRMSEGASHKADLWRDIESEGGLGGLWETAKQNGQEVFTNSAGSISMSLGGAGLAFYQNPEVLALPVTFSGITGLVGIGWGKVATDKISEVDPKRRSDAYSGLSDRLDEMEGEREYDSEFYPRSFSVDKNPFLDLPPQLGGDLGVTEANYYVEDGVWRVDENRVY